MDKGGSMQPWNLGERCKLNNTKLKMFMKMIHVDKYKNNSVYDFW